MRKTFRNALIILVIGAIAITTVRALRERSDPTYKGKRLSVWLREYDPETAEVIQQSSVNAFRWLQTFGTTNKPASIETSERSEADDAIRHIGNDAIPMLLTMLCAKDSVLTLKLVGLAQKQHWIPVSYVKAYRRNRCATEAFRILGASASNAVPQLIRIYGPNNSTESQRLILTSLGDIGPAARTAIPLLLRVVATNTNQLIWSTDLAALGAIHSDPEVVIPALTNFLHDPTIFARVFAVQTLGSFGTDAIPMTSSILELLNDEDRRVRNSALLAMSRIYGKPEWNRPVSSASPREYQTSTLVRVINGFGAMGTNAAPAVPALVKFLTDPDEIVRLSATNALKAIDPEAAAKAGVQ